MPPRSGVATAKRRTGGLPSRRAKEPVCEMGEAGTHAMQHGCAYLDRTDAGDVGKRCRISATCSRKSAPCNVNQTDLPRDYVAFLGRKKISVRTVPPSGIGGARVIATISRASGTIFTVSD
jgi:hypothetical protein